MSGGVGSTASTTSLKVPTGHGSTDPSGKWPPGRKIGFMSIEKTVARDAVRVFNKHLLNPAMMRVAGRKHFYASAIEHTGRSTGRKYRTPVVANRVADGFLVPLPYGTHVDWLQNLQATGTGTLHVAGEDVQVTSPTVVDAATGLAELPPRRRRFVKRLGIDHFLHLNIESSEGTPPQDQAPASP